MPSRLLKVGEHITHQGGTWVVVYVNECRAFIRPVSKRKVQIERPNGEQVEFEGEGRGVNIAPYTYD